MLTLFTMEHCPRCEIVRTKLEQAGIKYTVNEDQALAEKYADLFWPLALMEGAEEPIDFAGIIDYINTLK